MMQGSLQVRGAGSRHAEEAHGSRAYSPTFARALRMVAACTLLTACTPEQRVEAAAARPPLLERMQPGRISRAGHAYSIVYRLLVPPGAEDGESARVYPLLLSLHGSGARGNDNRRQVGAELAQLVANMEAREPLFVLAPQCPELSKWVSGSGSPPFLNYSIRVRQESDASKLVRALLDDLVERYPLDRKRIYVTGHSSGAAGTWDMITRRARHPFAAAVPVTGTNDLSRAPLIAALPLWVFHGAQDETSPVSNARDMVAKLRALGSPVRYTEYRDLGHGTLARAYQEPALATWLLAQRRP